MDAQNRHRVRTTWSAATRALSRSPGTAQAMSVDSGNFGEWRGGGKAMDFAIAFILLVRWFGLQEVLDR